MGLSEVRAIRERLDRLAAAAGAGAGGWNSGGCTETDAANPWLEFEAAKHAIAQQIPALLAVVPKDEAREILCYLLEEMTQS